MPVIRTTDTETQSLPTLSIIAPTPRTFTFPIDHNLSSNDSPASSRSNSPFEPELRPLALTCTTPLMRTLSPPISSSSSPTKRRKSASTDAERRPKKGEQDYVKRPENAFILFRRKCCEDRQQALDEAGSDAPNKKQRQADLSKTISQQWKSLSSEERVHWEALAKEKKKEHEQLHPGYVYRPQRARDQDGKLIRKKSTSRGRRETDTDHLSFVVPMTPRNHGRSISAPTPPPAPYQAIQIPNVYPMTPSCPTSPSLLPMISRRSAYPGHPDQIMSDFDYLPAGNISYGHAGFEPHIQSSDSLRSLFSPSADLTPLDMSQAPLLLPAHQIVSPGSSHGSSGPPSPHLEPYTPTSDMLSHSFPNLAIDSSPCMQLPLPEHDLQLGLQYQLHQEFDHMGYNTYSWGGDPTPALWQQAGCELQLGGDDFDLNAIPPIELGIPKYDEYSQDHGYIQSHIYSQEPHCQNQYLDQGLLGYDHAHHF